MGNGIGGATKFEGAIKPDAISVDSYEPELYAKRVTDVPTNMQMRAVYDSSNNPIYVGVAPSGLSESTDGWLLHKLEYTGINCTKRTISYDSWDNYLTATYS